MNRNGHFYFRIAVPLSLVPMIGKKELVYSLKTKDGAEARTRSYALLEVAQKIFQEAHANNVIAGEYLKAVLRKLDFKRDSSELYPSLLAKLFSPESISEADGPKRIYVDTGNTEVISKVFEAYLDECRGDRLKTIQKKRTALRLWLEAIGDTPVKAIGKAQARDFKQLLMRLPSNMHKRYRGQSIKDIDLNRIPENKRLSIRSVNGNLSFIRTFLNWAIHNGHYDAANPFNGLFLKETESPEVKRTGFSRGQLETIFSSPFYTGCKSEKTTGRFVRGSLIIKDSMYWVPLIALYSGARLQEIAQLYVDDLKHIEGILVFDFNENGEDKKLKTVSSRRKTPVHPKLVELGLLNYCEDQRQQGKQRMFSDIPGSGDGTYSNIFSKRFNFLLHKFGIKTVNTSFHSFRHTFIDALRNTDVQKEVRQALVGHLGAQTAHDTYGSAIGVKRLYEGILELKYDALRF